jgi:hypothetical protein
MFARLRPLEGLHLVRLPLVICILLLTLMAGCGGSGPQDAEGTDDPAVEGTNPVVWSRNVCSSLHAWVDGIEAPAADLRRRARESNSPAEARSAIVDYYADLVALTDGALRDLDEAGSPAIENGAKVAQALKRGILILRTALAKARVRARGLPVERNGWDGFFAMNDRIADSISAAGERTERYFDRSEENFKTPELDRIFDSECPKLVR